jgi:L-ribulokinase
MFSNTWGGLPDAEFLEQLDPMLAELRGRLYDEAYTADTVAGGLSAEWAQLSGLPVGTPVAVGALDAHVGAVGAGCAEGRLAKILGTSTCDLMVGKPGQSLPDIPGVAGIVDGSVLPGCFGIEAGQSAVGDIFLWFANNFVPASMGESAGTKLATLDQQADQIKPGQSGLLALDWNNGNRNVLTDPRLSGLILGQTLHTSAAEMYRAIVEATAFGARMIIDRVREYGVPVNEVVTCGGLAVKSPFLMQIYADVLNIPMTVAASDQTCALGAAIFGAVAAGVFPSVEVAQSGLCHIRERIYQPNPANVAVYSQLYRLYHQVHDAFGLPDGGCALANVMKDLITIRGNQR